MIPLDQISGVLWDLDGVLVDTGELHYKAMVSALASYKIDFPREVYLNTFGTNVRNILTITLGEPPTDQFVQEVLQAQGTAFCNLARGQLLPLPGVEEALAYFYKRNMRQAIASSSADFIIQVILDEIGVKDYFGIIVSGAHLPPKPNPDIFLQAATALQSPAEACLVIEDSPAGVKGARAAGMYSLAVTNSYPASVLEMADMVVDSLHKFWVFPRNDPVGEVF